MNVNVNCSTISSISRRSFSSSTSLRLSSDKNDFAVSSSFQTIPITIKDLNNSKEEQGEKTSSSSINSIDEQNRLHDSQIQFSQAIKPFHTKQYPVLIRNFFNRNKNTISTAIQSNALSDWKDLDYLEKVIGHNTNCFVEIGGSYSNGGGRTEIAFGDYVSYIKLFHEQYGATEPCILDDKQSPKTPLHPEQEQIVYMAQNDVTTLIPSTSPHHQIKNDFTIPKLCHDPSHNVGHGHIYNSMFWFGPRTCVSPLHYDPLDNLLMQFVGRKRVYLFPTSISSDDDHSDIKSDTSSYDKDTYSWHYAGQSGQQYNTSPIDILKPSSDILEKYPLFEKAPTAIKCIINPGEILYIPKRWWHHVTSLDTAISVNVWWR